MHAGSPPPWERGRSCTTRASAQTPPRTGPPARGSREREGDGRLLLNRFLSCPNFLRQAYFRNKKKRGCVLRAEARGAACRRTVSVCAMSRARGASFRCPEPQAQHSPGDSAGIARSGCRASTEDSGPRACGPGLCRAAAPRRSVVCTPPARWGPSLQTAAGRRGARPGSLCSPRRLGHSGRRLPTCPQRPGRPAAAPAKDSCRRPSSQPTPMTRTSRPFSPWPPHPRPPQAPSCQAGTRPSHPSDDSRARRQGEAGRGRR